MGQALTSRMLLKVADLPCIQLCDLPCQPVRYACMPKIGDPPSASLLARDPSDNLVVVMPEKQRHLHFSEVSDRLIRISSEVRRGNHRSWRVSFTRDPKSLGQHPLHLQQAINHRHSFLPATYKLLSFTMQTTVSGSRGVCFITKPVEPRSDATSHSYSADLPIL